MAQTIKIKRSTTNGSAGDSYNTPASLANGELAYLNNSTHKKLYIGRPGGGSGDIDVIGGKDYTDMADAALARTGGVMTGDIDLNNDKKITFGGGDLEIWHDNATTADRASYIKENGNGNLRIMGSNLSLQDSNGEFFLNGTQDGVVQLYCNNIESLRTVTDGIRVYNSAGNKGSILADLEGNADTATTATTATNVNLVADNGSTDSHRIIFANSQTGSQTLQTDTSLVYQPSSGNLSVGSGSLISCGDLTLNNGTINSVQTIKGASVLTIDPAADGATGEVIIQGSLTVKGTTTTIDSNTISVGDSLIVLNGDETGTPSQTSGIEVERGNQTNVALQWIETGTTSTSYWAVSDGSGVSPYAYPILQTRTAHLQTYTIEGGSF